MSALTLPGFANCHSHVFHRALRGRTHGDGGTFWTWREQMYALAGVLDPDLLYGLARATYAEMALAGVTTVGEFHYLHHDPHGRAYDDPNALGEAVVEAAREAGLRIALLDTCYLSAGFGQPTDGVQRRFSDEDAGQWVGRVDDLRSRYAGTPDVRIGAAIHSVRAVPADQVAVVAAWAGEHEVPLHVHLSEQPAENDQCESAHGMTPAALLDGHGVWGPLTTAVHATHLTAGDITRLGDSASYVCFCPTTERDLADGVGPSAALREAGAILTLGSDSNAVIDIFEEMRAVELNERLVSGRRGTWSPAELIAAASVNGQRSLGFDDASGDDEVVVGLDSVRLAGTDPSREAVVYAAAPADVRDVTIGGEPVVRDGRHCRIGEVAAELDRAITSCWSKV